MSAARSYPVDNVRLAADTLAWIVGDGSPRRFDPSETAALRKGAEFAASLVSAIKITSDDDREAFVRLAAISLDAAESFQAAIEDPLLSAQETEELEEILCRIEDIAETATLAADAKFDQFLDSEVEKFLNGQAAEI